MGSTVLAVAGGGGGGATLDNALSLESAGPIPGGAGGQGANTPGASGGGVATDTFATGGTLSAPGSGGVFVPVGTYFFPGDNGSNGSGNAGGAAGDGEGVAGGGGGGGYFGGGGGPGSGSGAGGSSFVLNPLPDTLMTWTSPSTQANGEVILTPVTCAQVVAPTPASPPPTPVPPQWIRRPERPPPDRRRLRRRRSLPTGRVLPSPDHGEADEARDLVQLALACPYGAHDQEHQFRDAEREEQREDQQDADAVGDDPDGDEQNENRY